MNRPTRKQLILIGVAVLVLAAIVYAFLPQPVPVETAPVRQDSLQVIVEEEGVTEVADRYAITAPVVAYLRRIELQAGDAVTRGQPVVRLEPPRTPILDPRSRTEAAAAVDAARATLRRTEASAARATAERERITGCRAHPSGRARARRSLGR
jgi:HlyD family secretion protein